MSALPSIAHASHRVLCCCRERLRARNVDEYDTSFGGERRSAHPLRKNRSKLITWRITSLAFRFYEITMTSSYVHTVMILRRLSKGDSNLNNFNHVCRKFCKTASRLMTYNYYEKEEDITRENVVVWRRISTGLQTSASGSSILLSRMNYWSITWTRVGNWVSWWMCAVSLRPRVELNIYSSVGACCGYNMTTMRSSKTLRKRFFETSKDHKRQLWSLSCTECLMNFDLFKSRLKQIFIQLFVTFVTD